MGRWVGERVKARGLKRGLVVFPLSEKAVARHGYPLAVDGAVVGEVTSGTFSPSLQRAIGMGYVSIDYARSGCTVNVRIRGREVEASIVKVPFLLRA